MKKILTVIGLIIVAYIILVVIAWNKPPAGQKEWIQIQYQSLEDFDPSTIDPENTSKILPEGIDEFHYFTEGGWVYVISHSSHFVDLNKILIGKSGTTIGDIALAKDNKGNIYQTRNHVCAGVFNPKAEIKNIDAFLSTMKWTKIK